MIRTVDFATGFEWGEDGRTVSGRMFPFAEVVHIREIVGGALDEYDEEFLPGCTTRMQQVAKLRGGPKWIKFTQDHSTDFDREMGFCAELVEQPDGVHGTFRLKNDPVRLDNWRSTLTDSHTGLSIEFHDVAAPITEGTVRRRRQIHVDAVTATPVPAYPSARILSMRADDDPFADVGSPGVDRARAISAAMADMLTDVRGR